VRKIGLWDGAVITAARVYDRVAASAHIKAVLLAEAGVDSDVQDPKWRSIREAEAWRSKLTISFCGPPRRERGLLTFLEAARILSSRRRELRFRALLRADSQGEEERLAHLVRNPPRSATKIPIEFRTGKLPREEFLHELARSTVMVFPFQCQVSITPVSVLEAMALGIPVVVSPVGDLPIRVKGRAGLVAADFRAESLADSVERILGQPEWFAPRAEGGDPAEGIPSWREVAARWAEFLEFISQPREAFP